MLESYFFKPLPSDLIALSKEKDGSIGAKISAFYDTFPQTKDIKIAIVGIGDTANEMRKHLYPLSWRFGQLKVADLGNIAPGADASQLQHALSEVIDGLISQSIITIILGNAPDLIYGQYRGYRHYNEKVEFVKVSPSVSFEEHTAMHTILTDKPGHLFNFNLLATQAYFVSEEDASFLDKMHFEHHRLGEIRAHLDETEPILRSAHLLSFDLGSVRYADAPGSLLNSPNGLYAEEAAAICRYAGISNKLSSVYFYGLNEKEAPPVTYDMTAQLIWYFMEGVVSRFNDHPVKDHSDFLIYRNKLQSSQHEIVFYKSRKSNRWWMEIPHPYNESSFFIGCSYRDYQTACDDEMPERWWHAYQRLI